MCIYFCVRIHLYIFTWLYVNLFVCIYLAVFIYLYLTGVYIPGSMNQPVCIHMAACIILYVFSCVQGTQLIVVREGDDASTHSQYHGGVDLAVHVFTWLRVFSCMYSPVCSALT